MRRYIIAGNWKMNKLIPEAIELANGLKRQLYDVASLDIVICPPLTSLSEVSEVIMDTNIQLGAQDVYWEEQGAFTGEVSCAMLKDAGAKYVIIGHSERRQFFSETNLGVNKKVKAALTAGLIPIVCVGESLKQREDNQTFNVVKTQIEDGFEDVKIEKSSSIVVAYEPVWAIGTGKNATAQQAQEVHSFIRNLLVKVFSEEVASGIRIQYGGSVKPGNIKELIAQADIDGALVGGASLDSDSFTSIVKSC